MKHLVVQSDLQGEDIRPLALLERWLVLAEEASLELAARGHELVRVSCPACDSDQSELLFDRFGFAYERCDACASMFVRTRPTVAALDRHYRDSAAAAFRLRYFAEQTASARFRHIIQSRVDWIGQVLVRGSLKGLVRFADIGTLYPGLFVELKDTGEFDSLASLDTDIRIRELLPRFVETTSTTRPYELICAFEQLEHQFSPHERLVALRELLAPDGILLVTTRSGSGFDLSVLGGSARYIFVPEHLNLLSLEGIQRLMERSGFELIELSTPGELDIGLVRDAVLRNPAIQLPSFVRTLVNDRSEAAHRDFQEFLQKHRLSSHVRLAARRRD